MFEELDKAVDECFKSFIRLNKAVERYESLQMQERIRWLLNE